ncbi:MAG: VWA domain-containing protein [Flavobacteriaceae bacterium]|nr:VWA domain-containing protein [Flavobacteriaceae bacterium]
MESLTIIFIIVAAGVSLGLAAYQYILKSDRSRVDVLLSVLRALSYFIVGLLLINPKFDRTTYFNEKPSLVVAVDNSESIIHLKQDSIVNSLIDNLQNDKELNEEFDLEFYKFGQGLSSLDSMRYDAGQSNINTVFRGLNQIYKRGTAPMLLITDGNQTFGNDYEYGAGQYEHPVFPVIMGDTITYSDLRIDRLNVNKYAFLKNRFPVEVFVSYTGNSTVNSRLLISSGNNVLFSKDLSFSKTNASQSVNLTLLANRVGVLSYNARIVPLNDEQNKVNNSKPFAVEVIDQKTNVAIISSISHPDIGVLKKAISSNEQRSVEVLKPLEFIRVIEDYQLAILYQPNSSFKPVLDGLKNAGRNFFTITGTQTQWTFLNMAQKSYEQEISMQTEDFLAELNNNFNLFIVEDLDFSSFPPLRSEFGGLIINEPYETLLFKSINGNLIDEPLLFTMETGGRRQALLAGENIWKWRAQSYLNTGAFVQFDNFIGKLVQYLASDNRRSRLTVDYESFYNGNSNITITAQFFNKNYEFDNKASLEIVLKNKSTDEIQVIPFVIQQNNYQVDLGGMPSGAYDFTVRSTNGEASRSGSLNILDYNVEQQFLNANADKLNTVAANTGGRSFYRNDFNELKRVLLEDSRFATIQKSTKNVVPLIDFKILLFLLALSLGAEWFTRKYNGLI